MMEKYIQKANTLIEALPYIQKFQNEIILIKFGGSLMEDPQRIRQVLQDALFMQYAGMRIVLVHGGGKAINQRLIEKDIPVKFVNGLRYTCEKTIKIVDDVLHNVINFNIVKEIEALGGRAQVVSGKEVLRAHRITTKDKETGEELDLGFVGEVTAVDSMQLRWIMNQGKIPVITPLAQDMDGNVYNINADMAACRIAGELPARKLIFLSDVPGILRDINDEQSLIPSIRRQEVAKLIEDGVIGGGMIPKINSAISAFNMGTKKVHMIDGRIKHSLLLEIFTQDGIGTEILAE